MDINPLKALKKKKKPAEQLQDVAAPEDLMPKSKKVEEPNQTQPSVFRDVTTGRVSGVTLPDGRTFLGLSPEETQKIIAAEQAKVATPKGAVEQSFLSQQRENVTLAQQAGQRTLLPAQQEMRNRFSGGQDISLSQAAGVGATRAAVGLAGGAGLGAVFGGGVGAIPGAALGAIGGFIQGFASNLKQQASGNIAAETSNVEKVAKNLRMLINDVNQGGDPYSNLQAFNWQLARVDEAHSQLKFNTQSDLDLFLGEDGTPELEKFEIFNAPGGSRENLIRDFQQALLNPNPNKIILDPSDFEE